jgi:Putative prokaryotic signal transducing protein
MWRINNPDDERLVTIARFHSDAEFVLARMHLQSAGIECFGRNEHALRLTGHTHGFFGMHGIELQVRESDAEDAVKILETESPLEEDESPDEGS